MCLYRSNLENVQNAISYTCVQVRHLVPNLLRPALMRGDGTPECVTLFDTDMAQRRVELVLRCPVLACPSVGHRRRLAPGWLLVPLLSHHHDGLPERERVEVVNEK